MMIKTLFLLPLCFATTFTYAQSKTRFPVWTFNTKNTHVYGLSAGYTTTRHTENVTSNGVRFELIGLGLLLPLIPDVPISQDSAGHERFLQEKPMERVNGINLSPLGAGCLCVVSGLNIFGPGSVTRQVNGIAAGGIMNITEIQNGLQLAVYSNYTYRLNGIQLAAIANTNYETMNGVQVALMNDTNTLHGVQIGIYNKSKKGKGLQLGIWNDNGRRKRPLVNF